MAKLTAGPGIYVCDGCVGLCVGILDSAGSGGPASIPEWAAMSDEELLAHLPRIASIAVNIEAGLADRVADLRSRGVAWARIGAALGMWRQSAWERFAHTGEQATGQ